jgi:putative heme transporter
MRRFIILALIVAAALFFYAVADLESMSSAILSMSAESVFILLLLLLANEIVKGLRWAFFLRSSKLDISTFDALTSYLAAQAATALPGGSLLGARLAQEHGNVKMRQATASLVGQTFSDAFALSVMATIAIVATAQRNIQLFIPLLTVIGAVFAVQVIRNRRLGDRLLGFLARFRLTRRIVPQSDDFREYTVVLMRFRILLGGAVYSLAATVLSTAILLVLALSLTERGLNPFEALYAHSFSTVARVLIPVPGGYGVSDGSLTGLLNYLGIGLARATFVALAYRTVIMVFRTIFGTLVLVARYPHLLVGQLRVPEQRAAIVGPTFRDSSVIPVQRAAGTEHNAKTTDSENEGRSESGSPAEDRDGSGEVHAAEAQREGRETRAEEERDSGREPQHPVEDQRASGETPAVEDRDGGEARPVEDQGASGKTQAEEDRASGGEARVEELRGGKAHPVEDQGASGETQADEGRASGGETRVEQGRGSGGEARPVEDQGAGSETQAEEARRSGEAHGVESRAGGEAERDSGREPRPVEERGAGGKAHAEEAEDGDDDEHAAEAQHGGEPRAEEERGDSGEAQAVEERVGGSETPTKDERPSKTDRS